MGSVFSGWLFSPQEDTSVPNQFTTYVLHTIDYTEIWEKWATTEGIQECQPFKQNYPYVIVLRPIYLPPHEQKFYVFKNITDLHNYLTMKFYTENTFPTIKETHEFFIANLNVKDDCDRIFQSKFEVVDSSNLVLWAISHGHSDITNWVNTKHIDIPIIEDI